MFDYYANFDVNDTPEVRDEYTYPHRGHKTLPLTDDAIAYCKGLIDGKHCAGAPACNVTGEGGNGTGAKSEAIAPKTCAGVPTCHGPDGGDDDALSGDNLDDDDDDDDTRSVDTEPDHPSEAARGKRARDNALDAFDEYIAEVERDTPVIVDGIKCTYSWNGKRAKYVYKVHNARTREYFEPDDWDGINGADEAKKAARSLAVAMASGNEGEFESPMVQSFGGDRGGRGVAPDVPSLTGRSRPCEETRGLEPVSGGISGAALPYVSVDAKCVGYSVANLVHDTDAVAALEASQWPGYVDVTAKALCNLARKCHIDTLISQLTTGWRAKHATSTNVS